ncbi:MAG: hypothetical protein ACOX8U_09500 [Bradymonadia bacterium]|jgi:hypothetical protein
MLQCFVSLKQQQPPRTESGLRSFFEALSAAVPSLPTLFCTSADAVPKAYRTDAVVEAALNPRCKFVVLRSESKKFWQCTFLLPDKQGWGAVFFDLQRPGSEVRPSADSLIETAKRLYKHLEPRILRMGDSEAREKLKSRHGLVLMPGLGRLEWLQIVHPDVYSSIYNMSDLVASPAHTSEVSPEDGSLFLRVYGDPYEWDDEENVSLANFTPGFLAGIAKFQESDKDTLRELEKLWSRSEKTAEKAYEVFEASTSSTQSPAISVPKPMLEPEELLAAQAATQASASKVAAELESEKKEEESGRTTTPVQVADLDALLEKTEGGAQTAISTQIDKMQESILQRIKHDYDVAAKDLLKVAQEGISTVFSVKAKGESEFYVSYQDSDRKVLLLNEPEDLAKFLSLNDCLVKEESKSKIIELIKKYYRPGVSFIKALSDLPKDVKRDRRLGEIADSCKPESISELNDVRTLSLFYYIPANRALEELRITQMEDFPLMVESKRHFTELENDEDSDVIAAAQPAQKTVAEPEERVEAVKLEPVDTSVQSAENDEGSGMKALALLILLLILAAIVFYVFFDGDLSKLGIF